MSGTGRVLAAGLAVGLAVAAAHAQISPTDRARLQLQLNESTISAEVAEVLRTAPGVYTKFPEKALRSLKEIAGKVAGSSISDAKMKELLKQIDDTTAALKGGPTPAKADPELALRAIKSEKNQKVVDAAKLEAKEVNDAVAAIAKDLDARRDADAKKKLADIAAKYPTNPAVLQLQGQRLSADDLEAARWLASESSRRFDLALLDVQKSALPALNDVEFPKGWKEKMERRRLLNAPKLTAEEEKLLKSMDTPIKTGLKDAPFQEAVQLMSTAIDQRIFVDTKSLEDRGVNLDDKVDVPGGVSARSALRVMLQSKGLTFVLRDNVIQVVTVEDAKKQCVTRAYDVRDLVSGVGPFGDPLTWGPYLNALQTEENARIIIDAVKKSIEPASWAENGGVGSITFHYPTMSIIVRAPSEVHADLYRKITK